MPNICDDCGFPFVTGVFIKSCIEVTRYCGDCTAIWYVTPFCWFNQKFGEVWKLPLKLTTDMRLGIEGGRAVARTLLKEGERRFCALSWGDAVPPETFADAHERLARTGDFWHEWMSRGRFPDHPWRTYL